MFEYISLHYNNNIYIIMKEPYETIENTYKRAWFIVKNYDKFQDYNKLYSFSILYENTKSHNMNYGIEIPDFLK